LVLDVKWNLKGSEIGFVLSPPVDLAPAQKYNVKGYTNNLVECQGSI